MARAQTARVFGEMNATRTVLEICLQNNHFALGQDQGECSVGYACSTLVEGAKQDASASCAAGSGVPQLPDPLTTRSAITATFSAAAAAPLQGKTMIMRRKADGSWLCDGAAASAPAKYLPSACR
ncbi:MAG: pilin [Zoogloeaceae bacterium]|nr:pilin [Zoogloeaceae bacterium]